MIINNTVYSRISNRAVICCFIFSSSFSISSKTEESSPKEDIIPIKENNTVLPNTNLLTLSYYIDNQSLLENIQYDYYVNQKHLETINDGELLILKHNAKNRKKRGNILFLHTNGESANHHRLVRPLSIQLSKLGWNVFIPNIAKEDFIKPKFGTKRNIFESSNQKAKTISQTSEIKQNDTEEKIQSNEPAKKEQKEVTTKTNPSSPKSSENQYYFDSVDKYQNYTKEICEKVLSDPEWIKQPGIFILNQTSSYWGLGCLTNIPIPTIFLDPQLPLGVENNIKEIFSNQSSSFYVFYSQLTANTKMASFSKALSSNQWRSKNQRYSQGILPKGSLNIEDISLAKRITGWVEKLRQTQN